MIKFSKTFAAAFATLAIAAGATPALAEETVCRASLGNVTVDNVRVPQNATCSMNLTRVKGTILVQRGATLLAGRVAVIGNIQAENAKRVAVSRQSRVGGSIQVVGGGSAAIVGSVIDGSLQFESNKALIRAINNTVGADVQAFQNTGGVEIGDNRIDGNLQCKSNNPAPVGGGNTVQGNKEDQCAGL